MDAAESTMVSPFGELAVRSATLEDAPCLRALRNELARWMRRKGIQQWLPGEVSVEWIELCILCGVVDVVSDDDRLVGSVTVVWDDPSIWGKQSEPAGYIHMLMLDRSFAGYGIGRSILESAERSIRATGRALARLDCPEGNLMLRSYYEAVGYTFVESRALPHIEGASVAALYEKPLAGDAPRD